jgi:hypothetical protein
MRQIIGVRKLHIGVPATVLLIALLAGLILSGISSTSQPRSSKTPVLGASIQTDKYQLAVNNEVVGQPNVTSQEKRVTVAITLTNLSASTLQISPGLQMTLIDQNAASYPMTANYLAYQQIIGGPLDPKARASYDIDFDIPANATPAAFSFQLDGGSQSSLIGL